MLTFRIFAASALVAGFCFAGAASAQDRSWNFGDQTSPGSCGPIGTPTYGNIVDCTQQPNGTTVDLKLRAYSSDGTSSTYRTAALGYNGTGSGVGVYNQSETIGSTSSGVHSMDNGTPGIDMMLLSFTSDQVLKTVQLGWSGTDGDFQVLAYTGTTAFSTTSITGKSASQLIAAGNGWGLVTTVNGAAGISTSDPSYNVNAGGVSSSYWLISAYNSAFGGSSIATSGTDQIKVLAITAQGPTTSVSSPGTLALAGLGLAFMLRPRRRSA